MAPLRAGPVAFVLWILLSWEPEKPAAVDACNDVTSIPGPFQTIAQFLLGKKLHWQFGRKNSFHIEQDGTLGNKDGVPDDFFMFLNWANSTFRNVTLLPLNEIFRKTVDMFRLTLFRRNTVLSSIQGYLPGSKPWRLMSSTDLELCHMTCKLSWLAYEDEWKIQRYLYSRGFRLIKWKSQADTNLPSFFIARDSRDNSLIVSIRGTNHINDVFTSFQTNVTTLELYRNRSTISVHAGFLDSARCILNEEILPVLRENPGARMLITGHSLGGAVATLLTLLLQRGSSSPYPVTEVRGITFGAPPSVAGYVHLPQLMSISMEGDLVPRLSIQNARIIRDFYLNQSCPPDHFDRPPDSDSLLVPGIIYWIYDGAAHLPGYEKPSDPVMRIVTQDEHNKLVFGWHIFEQHTLSVYRKNLKALRDSSFRDLFPTKSEDKQPHPPRGRGLRMMSRSRERTKVSADPRNEKMKFSLNLLGSEYNF